MQKSNFEVSQLIKLFIVAIIIILSSKKVLESYSTVNKERWREVVNYIDTNGKPRDLIVFYPGDDNILFIFNYYSKRTDFIKKPINEYINNYNIKELLSFAESYERVWFIQRRIWGHKEIIKKTFIEYHDYLLHNIYKSEYLAQDNQEIDLSLYQKKLITKN